MIKGTGFLKVAILLNLVLLVIPLQAAWDPTQKQKDALTGAQQKTMVALEKFKAIPDLAPFFDAADGYVVFPSIAKAGIGIGGAGGKGEVFQNGKVIGKSSMKQLSIGFQFGAQAFSEIIFFKDARATDRFTAGKFEFGAQASAVLIKQGVAVETAFNNGVAVFTIAKGGLMYEAAIAGQKFSFNPE